MKRCLAGLFLMVFMLPLAAQTMPVEVQLLRLQAEKLSESTGDELYVDITTYRSNERPSNFQVPQHPLSWPSRHLDKLSEVSLWKAELADGESANIVFSLIEQDSMPYDPDDLIGTIRLKVSYRGGKLESNWRMPNRGGTPVTISTQHGKAQRFYLDGENSRYEMILILKQGSAVSSNKT